VTPAAAERFTALADAERMGFGEFLEHMVDVYEARRKTEDGRRKTDDRPDGGPATSIGHRQVSAIAAAMRRLSQDGGVAPKLVRRHRAGWNVQLSLKVSAGVKERFTAVAAAHGFAFVSCSSARSTPSCGRPSGVTDPWCVCSMLGLGLLVAFRDHALVKILLSV
jgi:hypothetical protein